MKVDLFQPGYRFRLRAKIFESGFKTLGEYAETAGVGVSKVSRIINGWEIPSLNLAEKLRKPLDLSIDDFSQLL
jgi:hypothetical protein